ncbi:MULTISPECIES: colicin immunity protein Cui [unclassified Raoultella]|uniref:colicin immunity protein Cui n=1 Tax=unclassified Raoultella TaxID=2627600 RepID=UPI00135736A2|nr:MULTISPECIES: colicin immunity protein Cui [unclassified Raoultella]
MRNIKAGQKPDNSAMAKRMIIMLIITIMPIVIVFFVYKNNPDALLLKEISSVSLYFPTLLSANNPLLSSVMNVWCKTAPLWGLVLFILSFKHIQTSSGQSVGTMVKGLALCSLLYFPIIYMLLFNSTEMTESGRLYRVMTQNDYLLTLLFMIIYAICYVFTAYYLLVIAATFKVLNKK